jgi:hypothetical protein
MLAWRSIIELIKLFLPRRLFTWTQFWSGYPTGEITAEPVHTTAASDNDNAQTFVAPMSRVSCVPVTVRDRSEASHTTASEMSFGSAITIDGRTLPNDTV